MGLKLIGITGKARAGKDTLANVLVEEHGFFRMAFADPVKRAASVIFDIPAEVVFSDEIKEYVMPVWNITGRECFQKLGTEAIRGTFGDDFWVKRWACDYVKVRGKHSVVVSDVRTEVEAATLRELGGVIVHIERASAGLQGILGEHSSEKGIAFNKRLDIRVRNNGAISDLQNEVSSIVAFIEKFAGGFGLMNREAE